MGISRLGGGGHEQPARAAHDAHGSSLVSEQFRGGLRDVVGDDDRDDATDRHAHGTHFRHVVPAQGPDSSGMAIRRGVLGHLDGIQCCRDVSPMGIASERSDYSHDGESLGRADRDAACGRGRGSVYTLETGVPATLPNPDGISPHGMARWRVWRLADGNQTRNLVSGMLLRADGTTVRCRCDEPGRNPSDPL